MRHHRPLDPARGVDVEPALGAEDAAVGEGQKRIARHGAQDRARPARRKPPQKSLRTPAGLIHVVARPCPRGDSLADQPEERKPMLEISPAKVVQVIFQSREGDRADEELEAFIDAMNEDEKTSLVALAWVGRGAF
ncbi:MAG: DUF3775 domain-containing protein, partial [Gemmobacter sp.]